MHREFKFIVLRLTAIGGGKIGTYSIYTGAIHRHRRIFDIRLNLWGERRARLEQLRTEGWCKFAGHLRI